MNTKLISLAALALTITASAQTARRVAVDLTLDGAATMEVYLPATPNGMAVVDCPGGGYTHLSMQNEGHDWAPFFTERGIAYAVLTYRMPKGDRTIPMADAQNAIRTMRDSAAAWKLSPHAIGIMGSSAGGHLATTTATHAEGIAKPDFQILFYPVVSMDERLTHKGSCVGFLGRERSDKALVELFSNDRQVKADTPPAIIFAASDDKAVPPLTNALPYYAALVRNNVGASLHIYPAGGHGFGFRPAFAYHRQMLAELSHWLEKLKIEN